MILEVAVFNLNSAIVAEKAGADRLELCENAYEGGTTASYGCLSTILEKITIPVFPVIRPRGGDFLYDQGNLEVMKKDLLLCKKLGFKGAVIGLLKKNGFVDKDSIKKLIDLSYPMEITFHRAFDRAHNPFKTLDDLIDCGCSRVLTSGQHPIATAGIPLIKQLIHHAKNDIIILPGCGINSNNITEFLNLGLHEFHASSRVRLKSSMLFKNPEMQENLENIITDEREVQLMKKILNKLS